MRLMSAIVVVAAEVNAQAVMIKRRCDMEKSKQAKHRAIGREEELEDSLKEVTHTYIHLNQHTNIYTYMITFLSNISNIIFYCKNKALVEMDDLN